MFGFVLDYGPKIFFSKELIKFIYFEKATKFCEIFTLLLSNIVPVKSKVKISQNFVAFSEYMNFIEFKPSFCSKTKKKHFKFN